ncbi:MAG: phospholipid-binding protein MlaC [Pigmentiphaga sp.]
MLAAVGGVGGAVAATSDPDPKAEPQVFVEQVARQALQILKDDPQLKTGDVGRVNQVVDEYLLPYVNFEKTTRLAAGRYWREATPAQREALANEFRGTLVRTYSGALRDVNPTLDIRMLPFRGDPQANDVVVRTEVVQSGMQPAGVDYRLERTPEGWKVYDLSVEGIWLIQNYRNQFATVIQQQGIDGLIKTLAQRNQ